MSIPCKHPTPGNPRLTAVFNCRGRGVKRVMLGTIHGVTNPVMCDTHAKIWSDRCYRVIRIDPRRWCDGCGQETEPDTCHCGEAFAVHYKGIDHAPRAVGCVCHLLVNDAAAYAKTFDEP